MQDKNCERHKKAQRSSKPRQITTVPYVLERVALKKSPVAVMRGVYPVGQGRLGGAGVKVQTPFEIDW